MVDWAPLGELGEIVAGSTPSTHVKEYWDGDIPWITPADLTDYRGVYFTGELRKITKAGYDSCSTRMLPAGSILYSTRAPIGHCVVSAFPLCTNQGFKSIIPNERLNAVYGYYALRFLTPEIIALGRGATFGEVNKEIFESIKLPLPSLAEQHRIAGILDRADRVRRMRRYAQQMSATFLQAVFVRMFGEPVARFQLVSLEEIASSAPYALSSGPFGSSLTSTHYCQVGVPVLRGVNVAGGRVNLGNLVHISEAKAEELARSEVQPGDVVIVAVGSSGLACQVPEALPRAIMSQNFNKITPDVSKIHTTYLVHCINSSMVQRQLRQEITDTVRTFLSLTKVRTVRIPLPPMTLQEKFARVVQQFERLRAQQREAERQAEQLFQALLQRAFGGEL